MHARFHEWLHNRHDCAGRHGGRPFGGFGGMIGRGAQGAHGFRAGRKLTANDLQLLILALIENTPRHGYEIIKELDARSGGFYSPSPGMVYPALTYLEELGYAAVEADGTKKSYRITDEGRKHLDARRVFAEAIFAQLRWVGSRMDHVRRAFEGDAADGASEDRREAPQGKRAGVDDPLLAARHAIRAALWSKFDAEPEERQRVADILRRAADEIVGTRR